LPFVVKPTNCSGSEGARIVRKRADLEQGILREASYDFQSLIVQRYVEGIDMDINVLALHGRLAACSVHRTRGSWIEFLPHAEQEEAARKVCQGTLSRRDERRCAAGAWHRPLLPDRSQSALLGHIGGAGGLRVEFPCRRPG
jgi:biotin carboxylase